MDKSKYVRASLISESPAKNVLAILPEQVSKFSKRGYDLRTISYHVGYEQPETPYKRNEYPSRGSRQNQLLGDPPVDNVRHLVGLVVDKYHPRLCSVPPFFQPLFLQSTLLDDTDIILPLSIIKARCKSHCKDSRRLSRDVRSNFKRFGTD
jgi:hypothetical protein